MNSHTYISWYVCDELNLCQEEGSLDHVRHGFGASQQTQLVFPRGGVVARYVWHNTAIFLAISNFGLLEVISSCENSIESTQW